MPSLVEQEHLNCRLLLRMPLQEFELFSVAARFTSRSVASYLRQVINQPIPQELPTDIQKYLPVRGDVLDHQYLLLLSLSDKVRLESFTRNHPELFLGWEGWSHRKSSIALRAVAIIHSFHLPRLTSHEADLNRALLNLAGLKGIQF